MLVRTALVRNVIYCPVMVTEYLGLDKLYYWWCLWQRNPSKDMQNTAQFTVVHPNKDGQKGDIHSFIMIWSEKRKF